MRVRRVALVLVAALVGVGAGAAVGLIVQDDPGPAAPPTTAAPRSPRIRPAAATSEQVLLAWSHAPLPASLAGAIQNVPGVRALTVVAPGNVDLIRSVDAAGRTVDQPAPGWAIPLDAAAIDPAGYAAVLPATARRLVAGLAPGHALLGATSARLRRLGAGATVELAGGATLTVAGVVDDELVGGRELVVGRADAAALGLTGDRYALVAHTGDRAAIELAVRRALPPGTAVRFRAPGETPFLREGDAVLPQALVKERFGEFAYHRTDGRDVEIDPAWIAEHIVTAKVPLLGRVRCNAAILDALIGALRELEERNLGWLVDPSQYAGCWVSRTIAPGEPLSRHAWGAAFDLNAGKNPTGLGSVQDPRLLDVLRRWGFTTGASWLVPDPAHVEYVRPARPTG